MMNKRAVEMGCTDTHFTNAHGLDDPDQYTTARDMAKIVLEAINNETFCKVFGSVGYDVPPTNKVDEERTIETDNHLIYQLILRKFNRDEVTGGKTSSTGGAGSSLVCTAEDHDMKLICLVMGAQRESQDGKVSYYGNFEEMFTLLDFAFDGYKICRLLQEGQSMYQFTVAGGENQVVAQSNTSMDAILPINARMKNLLYKYTIKNGGLTEPISKGQTVATLQIWYQNSCIAETELHAMSTVRAVADEEVSIQKGGNSGGADLKSILAFIGIVCLVILVPLVGYLAVNHIRRAVARNKRRRRRQSRRRSR
jgi:D-alanyl-D-alanine carboxypeptidase